MSVDWISGPNFCCNASCSGPLCWARFVSKTLQQKAEGDPSFPALLISTLPAARRLGSAEPLCEAEPICLGQALHPPAAVGQGPSESASCALAGPCPCDRGFGYPRLQPVNCFLNLQVPSCHPDARAQSWRFTIQPPP